MKREQHQEEQRDREDYGDELIDQIKQRNRLSRKTVNEIVNRCQLHITS